MLAAERGLQEPPRRAACISWAAFAPPLRPSSCDGLSPGRRGWSRRFRWRSQAIDAASIRWLPRSCLQGPRRSSAPAAWRPARSRSPRATRHRSTVQQATPGRLPRPRRATRHVPSAGWIRVRDPTVMKRSSPPTGTTDDGSSATSSSASRNAVLQRSGSVSSLRPPGKEISWAWWRIVGDRRVKRTCGPSCVS